MLLRNGVYPHEYMDEYEKFNETSLPKKEEFYSNLNIKNYLYITCRLHAEYIHVKRACKNVADIMIYILKAIQ